VGTASAAKHDFVRGLGADEVVDYREADFAETVSGIDVVLDSIGGDYGPRSVATMRPGGTIVTLAVGAVHADLSRVAADKDVRSAVMLVERDHATLAEIVRLCDEGVLRVEVAEVLPMSQAGRAHELGETGRTTGKIVLRWD
jgi:NADPH:quinone reductase-like Zn-dependent oxidoreductase